MFKNYYLNIFIKLYINKKIYKKYIKYYLKTENNSLKTLLSYLEDKNTLLYLFTLLNFLSLVSLLRLKLLSSLFSSCLTPSLSVFLMLQSKRQKHHHHRNHQICNPPQPNPSCSLSLVSVMAEPLGSTTVSGSGAHLCHHHH